jgi:hypothetical protein
MNIFVLQKGNQQFFLQHPEVTSKNYEQRREEQPRSPLQGLGCVFFSTLLSDATRDTRKAWKIPRDY